MTIIDNNQSQGGDDIIDTDPNNKKKKNYNNKQLNSQRNSHIWKTIEYLSSLLPSSSEEESTTCSTTTATSNSSTSTSTSTTSNHVLLPKVISILEEWWEEYQHDEEMYNGILNKVNLLDEIEESITALGYFVKWLENNNSDNVGSTSNPIALVDVCCGKGICSLLASYVLRDYYHDGRISKIVMIDQNLELDWSYVSIVNNNKDSKSSQKPTIPIETMQGINLFEMDDVIDRLMEIATANSSSPLSSLSPSQHQPNQQQNQQQSQLAMIGIHLCKNLSPTLIGITNILGPNTCPFVCLAPCCLPRIVLTSQSSNNTNKNKNKKGNMPKQQQKKTQKQKSTKNMVMEIASYESPIQRQARILAKQKRINAKQRMRKQDEVSPSQQQQQDDSNYYCWKCGEIGHIKRDCPSTQTSSLPSLISRPVIQLNVSTIGDRMKVKGDDDNYNNNAINTDSSNSGGGSNLFDDYCSWLSTSLERNTVTLHKASYSNTNGSYSGSSSDHLTNNNNSNTNNWNRHRKSIFIVGTNERTHTHTN